SGWASAMAYRPSAFSASCSCASGITRTTAPRRASRNSGWSSATRMVVDMGGGGARGSWLLVVGFWWLVGGSAIGGGLRGGAAMKIQAGGRYVSACPCESQVTNHQPDHRPPCRFFTSESTTDGSARVLVSPSWSG